MKNCDSRSFVYIAYGKNYSEFTQNGYDYSVIFKSILKCFDLIDFSRKITDYEYIEECFNNSFKKSVISDNRDLVITTAEHLDRFFADNFSDINYLCLLDKRYDIYVKDEVSRLFLALDRVLTFADNGMFFLNDIGTKYLSVYFDVSRKLVFNPDNYNLSSKEFRTTLLVNNLNCLEKKIYSAGNSRQKYDCFSIYNPFAYDVVRRIINGIFFSLKDFYNANDLSVLRRYIFAHQAEMKFTRFTSYNSGKSYRVSLNRHMSELISCAYDDLSSIAEFKPIRLFEKIVVYINKYINELMLRDENAFIYNRMEINIGLIGHTEPSSDGEERELADLITTVVHWYDRSFRDNEKMPKLYLTVTNVISDKDISVIPERKRHEIKYSFNGNNACANFFVCDYKKEFFFSSNMLRSLYDNNNILFILDCPWLTTENYEIKSNGSLRLYSESIKQDVIFNNYNDRINVNYRSAMDELSTQYNRITSSDTNKYGDIARLFKEALVLKMRSFVKNEINNKKRKDIYIFSSESDGIDFSFMGVYPLTRKEMYEGKSATIINFSNKAVDCLSLGKSRKVKFEIKLWSLLKYVSVSYAYTHIKRIIDESFEYNIDNSEMYFEILRDIYISFNIDVAKRIVNISMSFSERFEKIEQEIGSIDIYSVINSLHKSLTNLVFNIYSKVVFSDSQKYGDDFIRDAFEMNLYSCANDVETMIFLHRYCDDRKNGNLNEYKVNINRRICMSNDQNYDNDFFKDKKLYSAALSQLDYSDGFNLLLDSAIENAEEIFLRRRYKQYILENIIIACDNLNLRDTEIFANANNLFYAY